MSDNEAWSDSSNDVEPYGLNYKNEIFFKSKFAKGRLKSYSPTQDNYKFEYPEIWPQSQQSANEKEQQKIIEQLQNENEALKRNNSTYALEISRLKININYHKVEHIESKLHIKKTAEYMDRLCKYLEELDSKLMHLESDREIKSQDLPRNETLEPSIPEGHGRQAPRSESHSKTCTSLYENANTSRTELVRHLRKEVFSFWVSGKAITKTFKVNMCYDRSMQNGPSSSKVESGFSSLESKMSREDSVPGYF